MIYFFMPAVFAGEQTFLDVDRVGSLALKEGAPTVSSHPIRRRILRRTALASSCSTGAQAESPDSGNSNLKQAVGGEPDQATLDVLKEKAGGRPHRDVSQLYTVQGLEPNGC